MRIVADCGPTDVYLLSCQHFKWRKGLPLKRVKTFLRSHMSHLRLTSLAVLSIERELAEKLNFDDVIKDFVNIKPEN